MRVLRWLAATALGTIIGCALACATNPWRNADCQRYRMLGYNVIVCDDAAVGQHCAKGARDLKSPHVRFVPRADNGSVLDYLPRACFEPRPMFFKRKPVVVIGKHYSGCLLHEIAHYEHPDQAAWVEKQYPCVGE